MGCALWFWTQGAVMGLAPPQLLRFWAALIGPLAWFRYAEVFLGGETSLEKYTEAWQQQKATCWFRWPRTKPQATPPVFGGGSASFEEWIGYNYSRWIFWYLIIFERSLGEAMPNHNSNTGCVVTSNTDFVIPDSSSLVSLTSKNFTEKNRGVVSCTIIRYHY